MVHIKENAPFAGRLFSCIAVCLAHIVSLKNQFVDFDDPVIFLNRTDLQESFSVFFKRAFDLSRKDTWRPIRDLSHWLDYQLHGHQEVFSHLHNLLLLWCVVWSFCALCDKLKFDRNWAYLSIVLAFVHPVQVETISWISGRKDLLATLFMTMSLSSFINVIQDKSWRLNCVLTISMYCLAVMSKGNMVVMPVLYLFTRQILVFNQPSFATRNHRVWLVVVLTSTIGLFVASRIADGGVALPPTLIDDSRYGITLLDKLELPIRYSLLVLWPTQLNHVYLTRSEGPLQLALAILSVVLVVIVLRLTYRSWRKGSMNGPMALMIVALMLPYLHIKPGVVYMANRYLFAVMPWFFLLTLNVLRRSSIIQRQNVRLRNSIIGMVFLSAFGLSVREHAAFENSITLWSRMTAVYPQSAWGFDRLGHALMKEQNWEAASGAWIRSTQLRPDDAKYPNNAAVAAMAAGKYEFAHRILKAAIKRHPTDEHIIQNLRLTEQNIQ